jgi:protein TilB
VPNIKDLFTTGNPFESWTPWKDYVMALVPQLAFINGAEILKSDRIRAKQNLTRLEDELVIAAKENIIKKELDPDKDNPNKYTKEYRRRLYKEMEEDREQKEKEKLDSQKKNDEYWYGVKETKIPSVYKDNGEVRICNQGKYDFKLEEDNIRTGITTFELKLPKFMDTNQVMVDLNPQYVRVIAKDKVTQLKFTYEIVVEKSTIQRSQTTGVLVIKCPIVGFEPKLTYTNEVIEKPKEEIKKKVGNRTKILKKDNVVNNIEIVKHIEPVKDMKKDINLEGIDLSDLPDLD